MAFFKCFFLIFLCLFLQACVSPGMSQELQRGKIFFARGDYRCAFRQLLPIAANGHSQAQYAIGYMYYYGYGVARDTDAGLFWMYRSARRSILARRAIALIRQQEAMCGPQEGSDCITLKQSVLPPIPVAPHVLAPCVPCPPKPCIPCPPPKRNIKRVISEVDKRDLVLSSIQKKVEIAFHANNKPYVWQLFGAYNVSDVKKFQEQLHLSDVTTIYHTEHNNKDWYVLTYGKFNCVADARLARAQLPESTLNLSPWIRNVEKLERV